MRKAISIQTLALLLLQMGAGGVPAAAQPVAGLLEPVYPASYEPKRNHVMIPLEADLKDAAGNRREELRGYLEHAGYAVRLLSFEELCDPVKVNTESIDLLVLPDASALPVDAAGTIEAYLRGGGDILAMNTPMWQRQLIWDDEEWLDRDAYRKKAGPGLLHHTIVDFTPETVAAWHRSTNDRRTMPCMKAFPLQAVRARTSCMPGSGR